MNAGRDGDSGARGLAEKRSIGLPNPALQAGVERAGALLKSAVSPTLSTTTPLTGRRGLDGRNFVLRVITAVTLSAASVAAVYAGVTYFAIEVMLGVAVGALETCALARRKGLAPSRGLAVMGGVIVVAAYAWADQRYLGNILAITVVLTMCCFLFRRSPDGGLIEPRLLDGIATIFAYLYVGWLFSFALLLRRLEGTVTIAGWSLEAGVAWMLLFILATASSDIGCYAFGKTFGRTPLAPRISPGKTLEGSIGGFVLCVLTSLGAGHLFGLALHQGLAYGLGVGLFAQLGDLWESAIKRDAGVKDSGQSLVGHGGVLDRFDSYIFAAPIAYLLIAWFVLR